MRKVNSMSKKKKKMTPRELEKKKERKALREKQKRRGRIYSSLVVMAGCLLASFLWPRENMTTYVALCVITGAVWGMAFDFIYARYLKKKEK